MARVVHLSSYALVCELRSKFSLKTALIARNCCLLTQQARIEISIGL
jgi:hypothetical protein